MVSPDMLKRIMSRIPIPAMDLDRAVRRLRTQPVRIVITHGHLIANLLLNLTVRHRVHLQRRLPDQLSQHLALGCEFDERELDALVVRERGSEGRAFVGVFDGLLDAVYGGAERGCGLADAVLVDEGLGDAEAVVDGA